MTGNSRFPVTMSGLSSAPKMARERAGHPRPMWRTREVNCLLTTSSSTQKRAKEISTEREHRDAGWAG